MISCVIAGICIFNGADQGQQGGAAGGAAPGGMKIPGLSGLSGLGGGGGGGGGYQAQASKPY